MVGRAGFLVRVWPRTKYTHMPSQRSHRPTPTKGRSPLSQGRAKNGSVQQEQTSQGPGQSGSDVKSAPPSTPDIFPKPEKAYKNLAFLNSPAARSIRIQCELAEPALRFKNHHIHNTIVFFGSARIIEPRAATEQMRKLESQGRASSNNAENRELRRRLTALQRAAPYYDQAVSLAAELTRWSFTRVANPKKRFYIASGGGPGIMEAANRGAREAGGTSVALGISLPFEQHLNSYADEKLSFEFHYFFVRKYWFFYLAKALIAFPGGFGTLDELFEMLTLIQTAKARKHVPVVLYGRKFWEEIINFQALADWGVISQNDLNLFRIFDDVASARDYLIAELTEHYLGKNSFLPNEV